MFLNFENFPYYTNFVKEPDKNLYLHVVSLILKWNQIQLPNLSFTIHVLTTSLHDALSLLVDKVTIYEINISKHEYVKKGIYENVGH